MWRWMARPSGPPPLPWRTGRAERGDGEGYGAVVVVGDEEGFLAALGMAGQRPVGEPPAARLVHHVNDPAPRSDPKRSRQLN